MVYQDGCNMDEDSLAASGCDKCKKYEDTLVYAQARAYFDKYGETVPAKLLWQNDSEQREKARSRRIRTG